MAIKKTSKSKKRTYKSKLKESQKAGWKESCREWESTGEELPKRITVENSCWRFE